MLTLLKLIRGLLKGLASAAAPWQLALGAWFGVMLGFLPIFPSAGPSPLAFVLLFLALVINCHLASLLLFMGVAKLAALGLKGVGLSIGEGMSAFAQTCADIPFLHASHWSHTGWLGMTMLGLIAAPIAGIAMYLFTRWFRTKVQPKLVEKRKLMLAGKVAGNGIMFKLGCWFMGL
jgi:uncharacterized protein (TIGR03546 family)